MLLKTQERSGVWINCSYSVWTKFSRQILSLLLISFSFSSIGFSHGVLTEEEREARLERTFQSLQSYYNLLGLIKKTPSAEFRSSDLAPMIGNSLGTDELEERTSSTSNFKDREHYLVVEKQLIPWSPSQLSALLKSSVEASLQLSELALSEGHSCAGCGHGHGDSDGLSEKNFLVRAFDGAAGYVRSVVSAISFGVRHPIRAAGEIKTISRELGIKGSGELAQYATEYGPVFSLTAAAYYIPYTMVTEVIESFVFGPFHAFCTYFQVIFVQQVRFMSQYIHGAESLFALEKTGLSLKQKYDLSFQTFKYLWKARSLVSQLITRPLLDPSLKLETTLSKKYLNERLNEYEEVNSLLEKTASSMIWAVLEAKPETEIVVAANLSELIRRELRLIFDPKKSEILRMIKANELLANLKVLKDTYSKTLTDQTLLNKIKMGSYLGEKLAVGRLGRMLSTLEHLLVLRIHDPRFRNSSISDRQAVEDSVVSIVKDIFEINYRSTVEGLATQKVDLKGVRRALQAELKRPIQPQDKFPGGGDRRVKIESGSDHHGTGSVCHFGLIASY